MGASVGGHVLQNVSLAGPLVPDPWVLLNVGHLLGCSSSRCGGLGAPMFFHFGVFLLCYVLNELINELG